MPSLLPISRAQLQALAHSTHSTIDRWGGRLQFALQQGLSFLGKRDVYVALGYKKDLRYIDYWGRYRREGIATRIVESLPTAVWTVDIRIEENETPDEPTVFEKDIETIITDHDLFGQLRLADIQSSIFQFAAILIGTSDTDLSQPMSNQNGPESITYLRVFGQDRISVKSIVGDGTGSSEQKLADVADPRFGLPRMYEIQLSDHINRPVHYTRILHVAKNTLSDRVFGTPVLEKVWNLLDDIAKIHGGGSEAMWQLVDQGIHFNKDPSFAEFDDAEIKELEAQLEDRNHNLDRNLMTFGVTATPLSVPVPQFGPNLNALLRLIAGAIKMPLRIFIGSETGQLASEQDRNNWQDTINEYQSHHAQPTLRRFVNMMIEIGIVSEPVDTFETVWPDVDELTVTEKADVLPKLAKANKDNKAAGGGIIYTADEIRQDILGKEVLEDEDKGIEDNTNDEEPESALDDSFTDTDE